MEMRQIIEQAEENIRQALRDYGAHTYQTDVLDDVTDDFIRALARDSSYAKQGLRELFSKSPVWDSKLDALVINGTRTHDKDYRLIYRLAFQILGSVYDNADYETRHTLERAVAYFTTPDLDEFGEKVAIEAIKKLAPKAYQLNRKPSKIFRAMCAALGVADETAGSEFQRLYAQIADEMSSKRISFKLYVSINPAHFLTMSNPKNDNRGQCLTSCHSFNSTDYEYNNGCSGYARDEVSFIVFTVDDPTNAETLNNRKITRQIFAYRPGSGLLLQSRMYNKAGGTSSGEETANFKLYRDLVQREISMLENATNLRNTFKVTGEKSCYVRESYSFGGYPDWNYENFGARLSFRVDCADDVEPLVVGAAGLCIRCGEETSNGLYCDDCKNGGEYCCEECGDYVDEELTTVFNSYGDRIGVCQDCLERHYTYCDQCGSYYPNDDTTYVDGEEYCNDCLEEYCERCEECDEYHRREDMTSAYDAQGHEVWVCQDCLDEHYFYCNKCGNYCHLDTLVTIIDETGHEIDVCDDCACEHTDDCPHCGRAVIVGDDGICPHCGENVTEEKEAAIA